MFRGLPLLRTAVKGWGRTLLVQLLHVNPVLRSAVLWLRRRMVASLLLLPVLPAQPLLTQALS